MDLESERIEMSTSNRNEIPSLSEAYEAAQSFGNLTVICPHCHAETVFVTKQAVSLEGLCITRGGVRHECVRANTEIGACIGCKQIALGIPALNPATRQVVFKLVWPEETWPDNAPVELDDSIKSAYHEARSILGLSPQAAAVLARRCLQHVLREKLRIKKKDLFTEIEEARKSGDLMNPTKDALHHIREIGNWGAHPIEQASTIMEVSLAEARYTMHTLHLVFHDLYAAPAKVEAMQEALNIKKGAGPGESD